MRAHWIIRLFALAAIAYSMACGGLDGSGVPSCEFFLVVTPDSPVRGDTVEVAVDVTTDGSVAGIEVVDWSISYDGAPVTFEVTGANGDEVVFPAAQAGVYRVAVSGSLGGVSCSSDARDLNVTEPGAVLAPMRLVIVPRSGTGVPPQSIDFQLPGGADYALSTLSVDGGAATAIYVHDASDPLPGAYLRAMPSGGGPELWIERFSQEDGTVDLDLLSTSYDLLVVPDADLPAVFLAGQQAADLSGITISADDGVTVTGTVADPAGDPLAGAEVQVTVAGAPSTIGTTSASGAFSLKARAGGPVTVTVTPPDASGLPALERKDAPDIAAGSAIAVGYSAGLEVRTVSPVLRQTDGTTPAAGARVTFLVHPITTAGSIEIDGSGAAARGTLVRTAQASGSGVIPDQELTSAMYDVIVEPGPTAPAGEGVRFALLDLSSGQNAPPSLRLAAPAHLTGRVVDAAGAPVEGAHLLAVPVELLARATTAGDSAVTSEDGAFNLALAARGSYQIRIDGPMARGRVLRIADAPDTPGQTSPIGDSALPATLELSGELVAAGGGALSGAVVQLQCLSCGPDGGLATVSEAVSDASGEFVLRAPDPGVAE
jgi:hypothetical protein